MKIRYLLILLALLGSLQLANAQLKLIPANFAMLPGWQHGAQSQAIGAFKQSCRKELKLAKYRNPRTNIRARSSYINDCQKVLTMPHNISNQAARAFFTSYFRPYMVTNNGNPKGLFTGYYLPSIKGSLGPTNSYRVPIYGKPNNLIRVNINGHSRYRLRTSHGYALPPTRQQVSQGPILTHTPIIAWVHSKIDRFFLQIQGSGTIKLANSRTILVGYGSQNGYAYYPIGRYLVHKGYLSTSNVSMQTIIAWLKAHPGQADAVMNLDKSFVFFRKMPTNQPVGAEGVPLTPGRSIAVDTRLITLGLPVWLSTKLPPTQQAFNRLMLTQDTGGAIRGAVRADIFWGSGPKAAYLAGHLQATGRYWLLMPK